MPKFRQNGPYKEPGEFLEAFNTVMEAHNIPEERYASLMKLCLEQVDARWLDMVPAPTKGNWRSLQRLFIQHFQHPQAHNMHMDQIRKLKMGDLGVQRYTDQFTYLANLIGWTLDSPTAIHQYKEGLPQWITYHLISIESGSILGGQPPPDVTMLGRAALSIESDSRSRYNPPQFNASKTMSNKPNAKCNYCQNLGHTEADCRKKKRDNSIQSTEKKPTSPTTTMPEKYQEKSKPYVKTTQQKDQPAKPRFCPVCGKEGHGPWQCPDKKVAQMVEVFHEVETQNSETRQYDGKSNQIEIPCTINGVKVVGILDTGATVSVLHKDFVQANGWTLEKRAGSVIQAFQGLKTARIGVVPQAEVKAGKHTAHIDIEVANLSNNIFFLIGMDLIGKIGIKLGNLPFVWPNSPDIQRTKPPTEQEEKIQLPPEIALME